MIAKTKKRLYYNLMRPAQRDAECARRGWYCVEDPVTRQFTECARDAPGSMPDMNRLYHLAKFNQGRVDGEE